MTVGEAHEEVLARRVDGRDRRTRLRSPSTARIASHLEVDELLPDERGAQLGRGTEDRVTFGHATIVPERDDRRVPAVVTGPHPVAAAPTIGLASGDPPSEPKKGRREKLKMPPSWATIR